MTSRYATFSVCHRVPIRILFLALVIHCEQSFLYSAEFEIEGQLSYVYYNEGQPAGTNAWPFSVAVHGCSFVIRQHHLDTNSGIDYTELASDGSESYSRVKFSVPSGTIIKSSTNEQTGKISKRSTIQNDSSLTIRPSPGPPAVEAGPIIPIWLAYASRCYFSNRTDNLVDCIMFIDEPRIMLRARQIRLRGEWEFSKDSYFLSKFVDFRDGVIMDDNGRAGTLPQKFATGSTNTIFQVHFWTNISGVSLPLEFEQAIFAPTAYKSNRMVGLFKGYSRNILLTTERTNFIPSLDSERVRVLEHRYVADLRELVSPTIRMPIDYYTTNNSLWGKDKLIAHLIPKYQASKNAAKPSKQKYTQLTLVALALVPIGFLVYSFWYRMKVTKTSTKERVNV